MGEPTNTAQHYVSASEKVVLDGLLCYLVSKLNVLAEDHLETVISSAYSIEEIKSSKKKLYQLCSSERNKGHQGSNEGKLHVRDMVKVLQSAGTNVPRFVANPSELSKMPPVTFDNIDVTALLRKIETVQEETAQLKAAVNSSNVAVDNINATTVNLSKRLESLEKMSHTCDNPSWPALTRTDQGSPPTSPILTNPDTTADVVPQDSESEETYAKVAKTKGSPKEDEAKKVKKPQPVQRKPKVKVIQGTSKCNIATVRTKRIHVHASRFAPGIEPKLIADHLRTQLKNAKMPITCKRISHDEARFAAFHVTAELENWKDLYNPDIWPEGAAIRRYILPKRATGPKNGELLQPNST